MQCGMLNAFLQKPMMVDRSLKPVDVAFWCEAVKPHVNARNAYVFHSLLVDFNAVNIQ